MTLGATIDLHELEADPDPILARLRAEEPVCHVTSLDMWLVTRWDDVAYLESRPDLFTAATEPSFLARALGPNLLTCDPPEHTRLQALLQPPLQAGGRAGEFVSGELTALADRLLDDVDPDGFDLVSAYAQPLAAASLATVLGLDHHGFDTMWSWCEGLCADLANFGNDPELTALGERAKAELGEAIAERIAAAGEDDAAISSFVRAGATPAEIVNNVRLMISGGINEPRDGIGLVTWVLVTRPELYAAVWPEAPGRLRRLIEPGRLRRLIEPGRLRRLIEPGRLRRLIEEVFRVYSPVGTVTRQATADVQLGGVVIPAGALVAGVLRSVNLDEDHWSDPHRIDLDRREGPHAAFALGAHRCLGEWLGRQEVRVGVEALFARFGELELVEPVELHGFEFRGPRRVMLRRP